MTETTQIKNLYDNLAPFRQDGEQVYVLNSSDGFCYLTVAVAFEAGDAGGERMTVSDPVRLYPGLNKVAKAWWARVEADAQRQRDRNGGVLAQLLDEGVVELRDLGKTKPAKVAEWLAASANIELVGELRSHPKHSEAASRAFEAWHSYEASEDTKRLRHFWAMATGSRKVA